MRHCSVDVAYPQLSGLVCRGVAQLVA